MMRTSIKRTLSSANLKSTKEIQDYIQKQNDSVRNRIPFLQREVTKPTMVIPEQFTDECLLTCCDDDALRKLEQQKTINWFGNVRNFVAMHCENDGNSLLHATSMYIFGIHDRNNVLRDLVYNMMFINNAGAFVDRWKSDRDYLLKRIAASKISFHDEETRKDWKYLTLIASSNEKGVQKMYHELESIHVFALANVIARPIIVLVNTLRPTTDKEMIQGLRLEGIYLPLMRSPNECEKSPVVLAFENDHFIPLFITEKLQVLSMVSTPLESAQYCVPLRRFDHSEIPVRFILEQEKPHVMDIKSGYLDLVSIPHVGAQLEVEPAAAIKFKRPVAQAIDLLWSFQEQNALVNPPGQIKPLSNQIFSEQQQKQLPQQQQSLLLNQQIQSQERLLQQKIPVHLPPQQRSSLQDTESPYSTPIYSPLTSNDSGYRIKMDTNNQTQYVLTSNITSIEHCRRKEIGCMNSVSRDNDQKLCEDCYNKFLFEKRQIKKRPQAHTPSPPNRSLSPSHQRSNPSPPLPTNRQPLNKPNQYLNQTPQSVHQQYLIQQPPLINPQSQQQSFFQEPQYQSYISQQAQHPYMNQQVPSIHQPSSQAPLNQSLHQPPLNQSLHQPPLNQPLYQPPLNQPLYQPPLNQQQPSTQQPQQQPWNIGTEQPNPPQGLKCLRCKEKEGIPAIGNFCKECYDKNLEEEFKRKHIHEAPRSLIHCCNCGKKGERFSNEFGLCDECHDKAKNKQSDMDQKASIEQARNPRTFNDADYPEHHSYDRKKVLCDIAGCKNIICEESEKFCFKHMQENEKKKCNVCCKNDADPISNVAYLCITCFRSQQEEKKKVNRNIGRGPASNQTGAGFIGSLDNFNDDLALSLPPIPQTPGDAHKGDGFISVQGSNGYSGLQQQNRSRPTDDFPNWHNDDPTDQQTCKFCNKKNVFSNGMCFDCYKIKSQFNPLEQMNCVNNDCKNPGIQDLNYLCQDCHSDQIRNYPQNHGMNQQEKVPCEKPGCDRLAKPPDTLCHPCKVGVPNEDQNREVQGAESSGPASGQSGKCKSLDCKFFGTEEYGGYCSTCFMEITKQEAQGTTNVGLKSYIVEERPPDVNHEIRLPSELNQGDMFQTINHGYRAMGSVNPMDIGYRNPQEPHNFNSQLCRGNCGMYGSAKNDGFCSTCSRGRANPGTW